MTTHKIGRSNLAKMKRSRMTFEQAKAKYVYRFTMEHKPAWANNSAPNGKYYAPQYASDREWYDSTKFPPENPLGPRVQDCYSTGATWPLGMWLDAPFQTAWEKTSHHLWTGGSYHG